MHAIIQFMPDQLRRSFTFLEESNVGIAIDAYRAKEFVKPHTVNLRGFSGTTIGMAGELFDLTNNPARREERELLYGKARIVSVGDVLEIEDRHDPEKVENWICMTFGFRKF